MATTRARSSAPGPVRAARRGGRPSKLTDELERKLCRLLHAGASLHDAALLVGVSPSTVQSWLAEGRRLDGRPRLQEFVAAVEAARAERTLSLYSGLQRAIRTGKWRAAAYFLERRFPEDWKLEWRYDKYGRPRPPRRAEERAPSGASVAAGGLPARLTPDVEGKLSLAFRLGAFPAEAAAYAGIFALDPLPVARGGEASRRPSSAQAARRRAPAGGGAGRPRGRPDHQARRGRAVAGRRLATRAPRARSLWTGRPLRAAADEPDSGLGARGPTCAPKPAELTHPSWQ